MIFNSAAFTEACVAGSSRYHRAHAAHQTIPTQPKIAKAFLHPNQPISATASGGANAPPDRAPIHMMPLARLRAPTGNHRDNARESVGNAPASAAPKIVRAASSDTRLRARP